ncbi:MAG: MFS transporter [Acidimicrobiales bacterium]
MRPPRPSSAYQRPFQTKTFLLYFFATGVSNLGKFAALTGFLFIVYNLSHSRSQTTGVGLAEALPYLVLGLIGGVIADRVRKARANALADLLRGIASLGVFTWYTAGGIPVWGVYVSVMVIQVGGSLANPARRALVVDVVADDSSLTAANGLISMTDLGMSILGPSVAAGLLVAGGMAAFFMFNAFTYFISAVLMGALSRRLRERIGDQGSPGATTSSCSRAGCERRFSDSRLYAADLPTRDNGREGIRLLLGIDVWG